MSKNRLFNVLIALALVVVASLTVYNARANNAIAQADRSYDQVEQMRNRIGVDHSWDQVEQARAQRLSGSPSSDRSYDMIESLRIARSSQSAAADRSYDAIENLRAQRVFK